LANYPLVATEEEVRQARKDAEEIHQLDTLDPSIDRRSEEQQVEHKFRGFLGEIVLCRANKWKRNRPHGLLFDAEDPEDGRKIEVKVRSKWFTERIPVKPDSDLAVLLFYEKNEKGEHTFKVVKSFDRFYLQSRGWQIYITKKYWQAQLEGKLIRDLR